MKKVLFAVLAMIVAFLVAVPTEARDHARRRGENRNDRHHDNRRNNYWPQAVDQWSYDMRRGVDQTLWGGNYRDRRDYGWNRHRHHDRDSNLKTAGAFLGGFLLGAASQKKSEKPEQIKPVREQEREKSRFPKIVFTTKGMLCNNTDKDVVILVDGTEMGILKAGEQVPLADLPKGKIETRSNP